MVTYWVWQVDRVQAFTFFIPSQADTTNNQHNARGTAIKTIHRLDGRASSVVLVVSPTKACILGRVGGRSKTTLFFYSLHIHCTWPAGAGAATGVERE